MIIIEMKLSNGITLKLIPSVVYMENEYGNGCYAYLQKLENIKVVDFITHDVRYQKDFNRDKYLQYWIDYCLTNWNGENGSIKATEITIRNIDN